MIDESYDRAWREGRAELNAGIVHLLARAVRKFRPNPAGETSYAPDPSPSSPPSPSR